MNTGLYFSIVVQKITKLLLTSATPTCGTVTTQAQCHVSLNHFVYILHNWVDSTVTTCVGRYVYIIYNTITRGFLAFEGLPSG